MTTKLKPNLKCDREGDLMRKARKLLQDDPRDLLKVSLETGIPYFWLKAFKARKISAPNVNRVEYLVQCLEGAK